ALELARGLSFRESGILSYDNLLPDVVMVLLGAVIAVLWAINPWWVALALSPLLLMYQALNVPQLKQQAQTDGKTGLFNARHFNAMFAEALDRARKQQRPLTCIMADLDYLRNINNTYGHLAGDAVLVGIGKVIRATIRSNDIAGRFGGEEFAVVLPDTDIDSARLLAERIRQAIEATRFDVPGQEAPIQVTMSLGLARFPQDAATQTELIAASDVAVYQAKHQGRNRVVCLADVPVEVLQATPAEQQASAAGSPALQNTAVNQVHGRG
ncbi:MAG TPA: GGDEF domain-containing protein, partial [Roseiflexaceae bacterium]|nr:GGDEF domain-containing protein [Roseiflexaceae bacterium]